MWKKIGLLSVVTLLAASLAACSSVSAAPASEGRVAPAPATGSESSATPGTITVIGTGNVSLVPDVAVINVGAEVRADTVSEAKTEVDGQMATTIAVLKQLAVDESDLRYPVRAPANGQG